MVSTTDPGAPTTSLPAGDVEAILMFTTITGAIIISTIIITATGQELFTTLTTQAGDTIIIQEGTQGLQYSHLLTLLFFGVDITTDIMMVYFTSRSMITTV